MEAATGNHRGGIYVQFGTDRGDAGSKGWVFFLRSLTDIAATTKEGALVSGITLGFKENTKKNEIFLFLGTGVRGVLQ